MSKYKVILTEFNNPIGIIIGKQSPSVYENVLDFLDIVGVHQESIKEAYTGKFLFNNNSNWRELFDETTEIDNPFIDERKIQFSFNKEHLKKLYTSQDENDLRNKDYAIIQMIKDDGSIKYFYCQVGLSTETKDNNIKNKEFFFKGELDIYMTYPELIKTRIGSKTFLNRAHTNRYDGLEFIFDGNTTEETNISIEPELRTNETNMNLKRNDKPANVSDEIWEEFKQIKWAIIFRKVDAVETGLTTIISKGKTYNLGYAIHIMPIGGTKENEDDNNNYFYTIGASGTSESMDQGSYSGIIKDPLVVSVHVVPTFPLNAISAITNITKATGSFSIQFNGTKNIFSYAQGSVWRGAPLVSFIWDGSFGNFVIDRIKPIFTNFSQLYEIKNEVKIWTNYFYKEYGVIGSKLQKLKIQFLTNVNDKWQFDISYGWQFDKYKFAVIPNEFNNNFSYVNENGLIVDSLREMPIVGVAYDQYMLQNRISMATGAGVSAGIGAIAGMNRNKGIFGNIAGAIGGAAIGGGVKVINNTAKREDLKNTPDKIHTGGGNTIYAFLRPKTDNVMLYDLSLNNSDLTNVVSLFKQFGYEINRLEDYNEYKNNRYYYNFIQGVGIFNNLDNQLSTAIKQQIDVDHKKGIRFWHVRDLLTFKGINVYDFENMEISLLISSFVNIENIIVSDTTATIKYIFSYNNKYNKTPSLSYSLDNKNWIKIKNLSLNKLELTGLAPKTKYNIYMRTDNKVLKDKPLKKTFITKEIIDLEEKIK